jgi:hypothetical protein
MGVSQTVMGRMEGDMLKWNGHVVHMEYNRWPGHRKEDDDVDDRK